MGQGYQVDLAALHAAADGITRTIGQVGAHPIASLDSGSAALGHARLASALATFGDRWHAGVGRLTEGAHQVADHLGEAARAYDAAETAGARSLDGMLGDPVAPDPGPR